MTPKEAEEIIQILQALTMSLSLSVKHLLLHSPEATGSLLQAVDSAHGTLLNSNMQDWQLDLTQKFLRELTGTDGPR
jgi:hypothetical protein